ncbi:Uncharacterized protein BM_BM17757 [Brugia malayi]|uniref:Uncharacterized protein n=1 Tax=Brugia malayi TaxID=6279 RepID=A0A4E9FUR2_BRUMA|nr:Uncharacterized protein BM_BM17757 [Brugia malayi]VIO98250.1 Uncharacterized protein BM_BM17757 [Brugia malayi]
MVMMMTTFCLSSPRLALKVASEKLTKNYREVALKPAIKPKNNERL